MKTIIVLLLATVCCSAAPRTARMTNVLTQADGTTVTTVKELTFEPSKKFRVGPAVLLVKTAERTLLTETRSPVLQIRPVVKKVRSRRISPPPLPPGFKPASFLPASTIPPTGGLAPDRRPMQVGRVILDDGVPIVMFTALQSSNQVLRFNYGDNIRDVSYLLAEWDAYPAEQWVGAGVYESQFPRGLFVTALVP